ncbi:hypothetical protein ACFQO7_22015 [Catellatospora aurea]|uniref:Uncharacterized protein n=1 Tax=Catellatospora aurea TaxID=1337874 RepID=A0ABW2GYU8_9ACTN
MTADGFHPDDTHPAIDPDADLTEQIHELIAWIDGRLGDEHANRQMALERTLDYLDWLNYRARQVAQQHGITLLPCRPDEQILSPNGRLRVPLPRFPRR